MHSGRKKQTKMPKHILRGLLRALIINKSIITLFKRAKVLQPYIERFIGDIVKGIRDDSYQNAGRIKIMGALYNDIQMYRDFVQLVKDKNFTQRSGGYTSIYRIKRRRSDNAIEAIIRLC